MMDSVTWKIGGEAGFGIMSSGIMLSRAFARMGYHTFATNEYPSLIRGGHNVITVRIAKDKFESMNRDIHVLVALNKQTIEVHKNELNEGAVVVFDPKDGEYKPEDFPKPVKLLPIPLRDLVAKGMGDPIMRNTVALGVTVALLGAPFEALSSVISDQFKKKGEEVVKHNVDIAKLGYDQVKEDSMFLAKTAKKEDQLVINASEAIGVGAARAGLKFAAIYPMTPINSLITFLADHAKSLNLVYKQPEDEIAGINMAIGASVGGVRSMVATSGGGFALMVEGLAWGGMIEAPLVIDLGMRVGPSTGMPTYTEQGELQFVIHAGHGEFPRIVLAPADVEEAYQLTVDAFNLADRYQVPVFLLTDKYLNESTWCAPKSVFAGDVVIDRGKLVKEQDLPADGSFKRYDLSGPDGVSPRSVPGMKNGFHYANSYEHDEVGHTTEAADKRIAMAAKRLKKFEAIKKDMMVPQVYGDAEAEITFITWGSTRGPVLDAMKLLNKKSRLIHYSWIYPFPAEETMKLLSPATRLIDVEQNATGQLAALIREHTGILIKEKILKYDGRPFFPEEIVEKL
ncbi:MAG: pyruvate flavodoxin/ferredoxin oxidoreductase domain-containing protein, 2-oxoglutarate ferredoxin oxidoreductase subunit alpha [Microgenomates group bacterium GW2011_GWC1_49_7]|nr:MAG: pyruvate flavodoxin/ferredoxin oxidoreductase domain-containing protein, 2-oxoglutarate ferredoxin oxidoreductase subunit alpha [Microgenomates group bacterium GW2011_GWC1_49_7]